MKLISMVEFVLEQDKINGGFGQEEIDKVWEYANFLNQPLTLGMFFPCDEEGDILNEPYNGDNEDNLFECLVEEYKKSKNNVLFEGFEWNTADFCDEPMLELENKESVYFIYDDEDKNFQDSEDNFINIIEDLVKHNLTLTPNAIKQFNL